MNYGRYGRELLLELKRTSADPSGGGGCDGSTSVCPALPVYNDVTVANCLQDLKLHVQALQDQIKASEQARDSSSSGGDPSSKPSMSVRPSILLQNAAIQRNKRCLLTYHAVRLQRIKHLYHWNDIGNSDQGGGGVGAKNPLCPAEQEFLDSYRLLVEQYTSACDLSSPDDLRQNSGLPPQPADRVQVRVLMVVDEFAAGPIVLDSGATANFQTAGSLHYLLYSDVEDYLREGHLQLIDGEEEA